MDACSQLPSAGSDEAKSLPQQERGEPVNLAANFTHQPEFQAFKKQIGHAAALEFLFNLGSRCQVERKTELFLPVEYIAPTMGFHAEEINPVVVRDALLGHGFLEPAGGKDDTYLVRLFTDHNSQLMACWKNGAKGGKPKEVFNKDDHVPFD